jgi:metal transporter CNNM
MLMRLMYPITHPLGRLLDHLFGEEVPTLYTKRELMEIVSEHEDSEESPIDSDEERIVHGALQFSHKTVGDCMTPRARVVSLAGSGVLDHTLRRHLAEEGYSRYPVVEHAPKRVVGVLYVKDVLVAPTTALVREVCEPHVLRVRPEQTLDVVLARMLKRRLHLAVVYTNVQPLLGVITLEDILEEVIQQEILDEDDT